jgi:hypothetical protein
MNEERRFKLLVTFEFDYLIHEFGRRLKLLFTFEFECEYPVKIHFIIVKSPIEILLKIDWILILKIGEGFLCSVEDGSTPSPAGAVQLQGHCWFPPRSTCSPAARQAPETDKDKNASSEAVLWIWSDPILLAGS